MQKYIINEKSSILEALGKLNSLSGNGVMTLVVLDDEHRLRGTVTDGDIRRGLLRGVSLQSNVAEVMHMSFTSISASLRGAGRVEAVAAARNAGIKLLPEAGPEGELAGLLDLTATPSVLPLTAIVMAGGKGERLRPMTLSTPKPLLEIEGRPIIDYNIEMLHRYGIRNVWVTVNYLAEQLEEHFSQPRCGINVECVREFKPLGTIGAATLVPLPEQGETLVMNSDLLTTINLEEMYLHHSEYKADITIAAIPYTVSVPYAILATDGSRVEALEEKPTFSHFANAGIYIFSNEILRTLAPEERTDATDLIDRAIAAGRRVTYYPISGIWIDIGSPADFRHACELMKHHRSLTNSSSQLL